MWWSVNRVRREGSWTLGMWQGTQSATELTGADRRPGLRGIGLSEVSRRRRASACILGRMHLNSVDTSPTRQRVHSRAYARAGASGLEEVECHARPRFDGDDRNHDCPSWTGMSIGLPSRTTVTRMVSPGRCFSTSVSSSSRVCTRLCSTATIRSALSGSMVRRM